MLEDMYVAYTMDVTVTWTEIPQDMTFAEWCSYYGLDKSMTAEEILKILQ